MKNKKSTKVYINIVSIIIACVVLSIVIIMYLLTDKKNTLITNAANKLIEENLAKKNLKINKSTVICETNFLKSQLTKHETKCHLTDVELFIKNKKDYINFVKIGNFTFELKTDVFLTNIHQLKTINFNSKVNNVDISPIFNSKIPEITNVLSKIKDKEKIMITNFLKKSEFKVDSNIDLKPINDKYKSKINLSFDNELFHGKMTIDKYNKVFNKPQKRAVKLKTPEDTIFFQEFNIQNESFTNLYETSIYIKDKDMLKDLIYMMYLSSLESSHFPINHFNQYVLSINSDKILTKDEVINSIKNVIINAKKTLNLTEKEIFLLAVETLYNNNNYVRIKYKAKDDIRIGDWHFNYLHYGTHENMIKEQEKYYNITKEMKEIKK